MDSKLTKVALGIQDNADGGSKEAEEDEQPGKESLVEVTHIYSIPLLCLGCGVAVELHNKCKHLALDGRGGNSRADLGIAAL